MFRNHKKITLFTLILIMANALTLYTFADLFPSGRQQALFPYRFDDSVITYGYGPHFNNAVSLWNQITPTVSLHEARTLERLPDLYFVGNSRIQGLIGAHVPYKKSLLRGYVPAESYDSKSQDPRQNTSIATGSNKNDPWLFSTVVVYHNNMEKAHMNYKQKVSNMTHEIGHSLSLAHPSGVEPSIMHQGIQSITPQSYDYFELRKKWGISLSELPKRQTQNSARSSVDVGVDAVSIHANYEAYMSVADADNSADIILLGRPVKPFEDRIHVLNRFDDNTLQDFYTKTDIQVEQVFKGQTLLSPKKNTSLTVIEPATSSVIDNKETYISYEGYRAMEHDQSYLIFLKKNSYGEFSVINMELGRIDVPSKNAKMLTESAPTLKNSSELSNEKQQFIDEALSKYLK